MTIEIAGKGRQEGDGRVGELILGVMGAPETSTVTATLTVAQTLGRVIVATTGIAAVTYTLPAVALMEAELNTMKINASFDLTIINLGTSSGVITVAAGTGWTLVGMVTIPITTAAGSTANFRARKTADGAWTLYRIG